MQAAIAWPASTHPPSLPPSLPKNLILTWPNITLPDVVLQDWKAEPTTALTSKMSKKGNQQADANGTFAALGLEDEDPEVAAQAASKEAAPRASKKGKKKKVQCSARGCSQCRVRWLEAR